MNIVMTMNNLITVMNTVQSPKLPDMHNTAAAGTGDKEKRAQTPSTAKIL